MNESPAVETASAEIDLAAIMAKSGISTDGGNAEVSIPDIKIEPPVQETAATVETTATPAPTETVQETTKPVETQAPVEQTPNQEQATPAPTLDWKEVLKQQSATEVLKAIGFDDSVVDLLSDKKAIDPKMINLVKSWEQGADVKPYLEALSTDYTKFTSEDLMRRQLAEQFPGLSKDQLDMVYNKKVVQAYSLDPENFEESDRTVGKILLDADAEKYRQTLIAKQKDLLLNPPPAPQKSQIETEYLQMKEAAENSSKAYKQVIESNPVVKKILTEGKIVIGEGAEALNLVLPKPQETLNMLFDNSKVWNSFNNADKTPKPTETMLLAAFQQDPLNFCKTLINHGKSLGGKEIANVIENPTKPIVGSPSKDGVSTEDPAAAMAKSGRVVAG